MEERFHKLYALHRAGSDVQILKSVREQWFDGREVAAELPEKSYQSKLGENSDCILSTFFHNYDAVHAGTKDLDRIGQECSIGESDKRLPPSNVSDIPQRNGLTRSALTCELVERGAVAFIGVRKSND